MCVFALRYEKRQTYRFEKIVRGIPYALHLDAMTDILLLSYRVSIRPLLGPSIDLSTVAEATI